ncbi:phosphate ABC transporter substrate-binding/OmpA family protein [Marinomonas sp. THO17]|uniref:phosphate ABC transporter substrate-binding/OmpA family protein n=1 Tax=Marinomonas sp. THO17 TaxID=3149048 RepID=UPI00336BC942
MNKLIAAGVLVVGLASIVGLKFYFTEQSNDLTALTSDAGNFDHSIRVGVDSWAGYYPLCSKYIRSDLRNQGILLQCINDSANLDERFENLRRGELDLAVSTVDAYLTVGEQHRYPGTIVSVIDESKGGDAMVCYQDMVDSIDDLKTNPNLRVALTPDSPSEHLLRSLAVHFDVETFQSSGSWRVDANGSEDALNKLQSRSVDCAVVWEPDVTKARQLSGTKKVIGSEDTERLIVDVLLSNREFIQKKPDVLKHVLSAYFDALVYFKNNPNALVVEMSKEAGLNKGAARQMLEGVKWASLSENVFSWYSSVGHERSEYLVESITSTLNILKSAGVLDSNPLPNQDVYAIINSTFVTELFDGNVTTTDSTQEARAATYRNLSVEEWLALPNVGTLKVRKVQFARSNGELSMNAKRMLDEASADLSHYPNFRIMVKGHTGTYGDMDANRRLSETRAKAVVRYLNIVHGIDESRMLAIGAGSDEPLAQMPNEGLRAYEARLPRVELILKVGDR